jgi:acetyl-CoA acetyltransferase
MSAQDIDLVEVNEAFAPQCMAVAKAIGVDMSKFVRNPCII